MMQHYLQVKEKHKDCFVFYRLGDFYEMFFDDAVKASKLLDLTLTGRDCGLEERAPMCGIPFHAADTYIAKLVSLGEKVAICEQLSDPSAGEKLVKRDVVKIITAGTVTNNELIDERVNNFLCSAFKTLKKSKKADETNEKKRRRVEIQGRFCRRKRKLSCNSGGLDRYGYEPSVTVYDRGAA